MTLRALIFCSFAVSLAASEQPLLRGRLCIAGSDCRDYASGQALKPADVPRTFQLTNDTETSRCLGILNAGETTITCDRYATLEMRITAPNFRRRGSVQIGLTDEMQRAWEFPLHESHLRSGVTVRLPGGTYVVAVESAHYRSIRRTVHIGEKPETLGAALEPLSVLSGRVFERGTARGVGGAVIRTNVDTTAIADANGSFAFEADPDQWPATIAVSAAGYAETTLTIPKARKSAALDDVFLSRGGSIVVETIHPVRSDVIQIELQKLQQGDMFGSPLRSIPMSPDGPAKVRFDSVEPGRYVVLAKGKGSCEQRGEVVDLAGGEQKSLQLHITPVQLRFRAAMMGEPLAGAEIRFRSRDGHWKGDLVSGPEGEVSTGLWQTGEATASVFVESLMNVPHDEKRAIPDDEEFEWNLEVPARRIAGVVVDSGSGKPVRDPALTLRVRGDDGSFVVRTRGDAEGRFQFMPVPHGRHTITAAALTHLQGQLSYTFSPPEESRDITIRLESGAFVHLRITDAAGAPVAGAIAMQYKGLVQTRLSVSDASGVAEIIVPEGEARDVYVIPRDGSFGIIRVTSKSTDSRIRLPQGTSRIEIRAESELRQPIPNVSVVMRYNRQVLPREVVQWLGRIQGARTTSRGDGRIVFDHMPAGLYEFWPAGSPAEMRMLFAGMGPQAPVTMSVTPGDNVAVLTFEPVHPK